MESIPMGCVSYSLKFFPEGCLGESCFKRAELAAANELQRIVDAYRRTGWKHAVASSGTAKSLAAILRESDLCEQGISAEALDKLRALFIKAGEVDKLELPGLREDRAAIIPGPRHHVRTLANSDSSSWRFPRALCAKASSMTCSDACDIATCARRPCASSCGAIRWTRRRRSGRGSDRHSAVHARLVPAIRGGFRR